MVAYYDADLLRWKLTLRDNLDRIRITGRLTRGETDNTKPVDKIVSDGEGNYYKITQTYWSEKKTNQNLIYRVFLLLDAD